MTATVAIGEFARLTHLSVKTLRYYHEIELLEPVEVDAGTGYRRYSTDQVEQAHLIRRLRDLDMPLPEIRTVLATADPGERDTALRAHLIRMEAALERTREVVVSLRALLTAPSPPIEVDYRIEPAFTALTVTDRIERVAIADWCGTAFEQLYTTLLASGVDPGGVAGATYSNEFFTDDNGAVTAFVPLPPGAELVPTGAFAVVEFPARHFARFFVNHGLLRLTNRPQWRTVLGGSPLATNKVCAPVPNTPASSAYTACVRAKPLPALSAVASTSSHSPWGSRWKWVVMSRFAKVQ